MDSTRSPNVVSFAVTEPGKGHEWSWTLNWGLPVEAADWIDNGREFVLLTFIRWQWFQEFYSVGMWLRTNFHLAWVVHSAGLCSISWAHFKMKIGNVCGIGINALACWSVWGPQARELAKPPERSSRPLLDTRRSGEEIQRPECGSMREKVWLGNVSPDSYLRNTATLRGDSSSG